ncbi:MAG: DUF3105 domain-containing protein [Anaerolineae bacterium]|nr:DUF3105 domain-containing protein [Anaerolineae bacterium]
MTKKNKQSSWTPAKKPKSSSQTMDRIVYGGSIVFIVAIFAIMGLNAWSKRPIDIRDIESIDPRSRQHLETVAYDTEDGVPPSADSHSPTWQNCGIYASPVRAENALHALEHGAVWITYQPNLPLEQVAELQAIARSSTQFLLSPYPNLESPIILTSWAFRLRVDNADDKRIGQFIRNYENDESAPEPGARCSGGVGQPIG